MLFQYHEPQFMLGTEARGLMELSAHAILVRTDIPFHAFHICLKTGDLSADVGALFNMRPQLGAQEPDHAGLQRDQDSNRPLKSLHLGGWIDFKQ